MNHDSPQSLLRPIPFRNMTGEPIPAFAVMAVLGVSFEHGVAFLNCGKPDGTFRRHYAINGPQDVAAGRRGSCYRSGDVRALYDEGTPITGESWGPRPGSWKLNQGYPGAAVQGIVHGTLHLARIDCEPITRALVRTTAAIAINANSTAYHIYVGSAGSETDAGFTTVPAARNRSGVPIGIGQWAHLVWVGSGWELQPLRQPALCAVPPCGQGIPARVGDTPGQQTCCLFSIQAGSLVPVLDAGGQPARAAVYNVRTEAIPPLVPPHESYVLVHADSSGRWVCESPRLTSVGGSATTTTTPRPTLPTCAGTCKWNWSIGQQAWQLADDGCGTTTTATPTSTTTADPCLCPLAPATTPDPTTTSAPTTTAGPGTSTSTGAPTTTTSTTTTPAPQCRCVYPSYCGTQEGECTYTQCASGYSQPQVECTTTTSTTTTSCDCNTTTTAAPDPDCTNCHWFNHPLLGWYKTFHGCQGNCTCDLPASGDACSSSSSPCVTIPDVPLPPCSGKCQYICAPGDGWWLVESGCPGASSDGLCSCAPPSVPCEICGAPLETNCQVPSPPPPPDPCGNCYSTTTTTTTSTTPNPCGDGCLWQGSSSGEWSVEEDECGPECDCAAPSYEAHDNCETARTRCYPITTTTGDPTTTSTTTTSTTTSTTTTSTTSTTTPEPYYCNCFAPEYETGECVQGFAAVTDANCGGPYANLAACLSATGTPCGTTTTTPPTTTTSTTTSTTTTTTCNPHVECAGNCVMTCDSDDGWIWGPPGSLCDNGCICDIMPWEAELIDTPCTPASPQPTILIPCCNNCAGATLDQCGLRTTTTPAP